MAKSKEADWKRKPQKWHDMDESFEIASVTCVVRGKQGQTKKVIFDGAGGVQDGDPNYVMAAIAEIMDPTEAAASADGKQLPGNAGADDKNKGGAAQATK